MSEWVKIGPDCPMPEHDAEVLVTVVMMGRIFGPEPLPMIDAASYDGKRFVGHWTWEGPEFKSGSSAMGSVLTAWMPAPEPFRGGKP